MVRRKATVHRIRGDYRALASEFPDPENTAPAWNNLAYVLQALGRRQEAMEADQKAVDFGGPDDPNYRSTLYEITNM